MSWYVFSALESLTQRLINVTSIPWVHCVSNAFCYLPFFFRISFRAEENSLSHAGTLTKFSRMKYIGQGYALYLTFEKLEKSMKTYGMLFLTKQNALFLKYVYDFVLFFIVKFQKSVCLKGIFQNNQNNSEYGHFLGSVNFRQNASLNMVYFLRKLSYLYFRNYLRVFFLLILVALVLCFYIQRMERTWEW